MSQFKRRQRGPALVPDNYRAVETGLQGLVTPPKPNSVEGDLRFISNYVAKESQLLESLDLRMNRLVWLNEGPDSYETIDDSGIPTTTEQNYSFDPYVLWACSFVNNGSSGNLFIRFTSDYGRIKQYKLPPGKSTSINDIKGGFGDSFRVIADTAGIEFIAVVTLKKPWAAPPASAFGLVTTD